ncbi:TrmH family RNA methyltransferase [Jiangella asiatica]|uniref:RNA methyltransferase n=1 Tax=Jiangella asiatica TaxID=2530372 RepID=A0A4V2Z2W4_9ACTN|nr:TrmH family RNA methyltransferase [Jiangella asiatica]TDE10418.1 RNA methyltransferase [Jiangella asiatica]
MRRVERRNATFQQWRALLTNRAKRNAAGELIVQGVRPITVAAESGLTFRTLLFDGRPNPSAWAKELLAAGLAPVVQVAPELLAELGERADGVPELLAVVRRPDDDLSRLPSSPDSLVVVFDRPGSPGNIGSLARSADALGAHALVTTGHAADVWDPQSVRASTGSVFALPVVRLASQAPLLSWVDERRRAGVPVIVLGTDESGTVDLPEAPLTGPVVVVVGNETAGMSRAWHEACDVVVRIPMGGSASSLNAAAAGTVVLYEASRQRSGLSG